MEARKRVYKEREIPSYARRLRELREDRDLSQQSVADYLHVAQRTYADYELGVIRIPVDMLILLARYYDVDMNYMCGLTLESNNFPKVPDYSALPRNKK